MCALGHELVRHGHAVLFLPAYKLVQRLLLAKREAGAGAGDQAPGSLLSGSHRRRVQQNREEMEVLFTFLSARYERRSVMITSNLVFSQWEKIFKDPMTTACAIDRLVHHATILDLTGPSIRQEEAKRRNRSTGKKPKEEK